MSKCPRVFECAIHLTKFEMILQTAIAVTNLSTISEPDSVV
jgi:hypothetical protein